MNTNAHGIPDLMYLMVDNYRQGKPLLEDAVMFRGSRLPDQTMGSFSKDLFHASLLPQVAASYTHNWKGQENFIGTYPVDRDKTRFFGDFGLEEHLQGKPAQSYSVKQVEQALTPLVAELSKATTSREAAQAEEKLERVIKKNFYEAGVPTRDADGQPTRPAELFLYKGTPDVQFRKPVLAQLEQLTAENMHIPKGKMYREFRNAAIDTIHTLSTMPSKAQKALSVIKDVAQRDFANTLMRSHGSKPLNEFLDGVGREPLSKSQETLGKFARALNTAAHSNEPGFRAKAESLAKAIEDLPIGKAKVEDVLKAGDTARTSAKSAAPTRGQEPSR